MPQEQLDLFYATSIEEEKKVTEQDLQKQHDTECQEHHLTPRQWKLLNLIKINSFVDNRKTTQREIYDALKGYGYEWNEKDANTHDHCVAIWNDIKEINLSYDTDKIIISKNFEYWIGNEQETQEFLDKLWNDLSPRLSRYWAYLQKANRNGQGQIIDRKGNAIDENSKARAFIESYGKEKIS